MLSLADEYMKYKWISTEIATSEYSIQYDDFKSIIISKDVLIGKFEGCNNTKAIFISPIEYQKYGFYTLSLSFGEDKKAILHKCDGCEILYPDNDGNCRAFISSSQPCIVTLTN